MFKKIAPKFLKRIDEYLLANHPILWISKLHYVAWYGLLLYLFSGLLGYVMPINLTSSTDAGLWYVLLTILSFILSWFWGFRYLIFNKEKNYGNLNFTDEYKNFGLVFLCVLIFVCVAFPFVMSNNKKVANLYTNAELIEDINTLNALEPYIPTNYYNYENSYDTSKKETFFNVRKFNNYYGYTPYYMLSDSAKFGYEERYTNKGKDYLPCKNIEEVKQKIQQHIAICKKYTIYPTLNVDKVAQSYFNLYATGWANVKAIDLGNDYYKEEVRTAFRNLYSAKFETLFIWRSDFLWAIFYVTITLALLLVLFKLNNWRQFLVTTIVLALYPLMAFIITQIMSLGNNDASFDWFVFVLFGSAVVSLVLAAKEKHQFVPFYNILNQVFYLLLLFVPMLIMYYLYRHTNIFRYYYNFEYDYKAAAEPVNHVIKEAVIDGKNVIVYSWQYYYEQWLRDYWQKEYNKWFNIAKYGAILILIAGLPLMKKLFVKQMALPRKS